jgi:hypothetical protein
LAHGASVHAGSRNHIASPARSSTSEPPNAFRRRTATAILIPDSRVSAGRIMSVVRRDWCLRRCQICDLLRRHSARLRRPPPSKSVIRICCAKRPEFACGFNGSSQHFSFQRKTGVEKMKQRRRIYYSAAQRAEIWDRWQRGDSLHEIGRLFDRGHSSISGMIKQAGGVRPLARKRSRLALTLAEREEISRGLVARQSIRSMAVAQAFRLLSRWRCRGLRVNLIPSRLWRFLALPSRFAVGAGHLRRHLRRRTLEIGRRLWPDRWYAAGVCHARSEKRDRERDACENMVHEIRSLKCTDAWVLA